MQNFKLLCSVTLIVVFFGYAHPLVPGMQPFNPSNSVEDHYRKLRKEATNCIVGETKVLNNGCYVCHCVEKGVMKCGNVCGFKRPETTLSEAPPRYKAPIKPTYSKALSSSMSKLDDWTPKWKKFFKETAFCKVGERRKDPDDCNWCECVKPGSMTCDTNNKCSKKTRDTLSSSSHKMKASSERLQRLKQFADKAAECTVGDRMKDYDNCNWCECMEEGVMMCGRKRCSSTTTRAPSRLSHSQDATMVVAASKSKLSLKNYYNLRDKSKNCTPDGMTINTPCHVCKCIYHGAMKCVSVRGSTCDNGKKTKKSSILKLDLPSDSDYLSDN